MNLNDVVRAIAIVDGGEWPPERIAQTVAFFEAHEALERRPNDIDLRVQAHRLGVDAVKHGSRCMSYLDRFAAVYQRVRSGK